jgi:hypothetical protein
MPAKRQPGPCGLFSGVLDSDHDVLPQYGIDVDDLGPDHSVNADPGVVRIREAACLLGTRAWIMVTTPGGFEGAEGDPAPGEDAISQWTSVVTRPEELTWFNEALALNVMGTEDPDDEPDRPGARVRPSVPGRSLTVGARLPAKNPGNGMVADV